MARQRILNNINQNWNDQMGGNYLGFGNNNQGIASPSLNVPQNMRKYFSDTNQMVYPGSAYSPHRDFEEMQFSETAQAPEKKGMFSKFTTPMMSVLNKLKYERPPQKQIAYDEIMGSRDDEGWGTYKGNKYNIQDNKIYSELNPQGLNFDSGFGSKSIEEMDQKKLDWAQKRYDAGKGLSQRLRNILIQRGLGGTPGNITQDAPSTVDLSTIVDRPVNTGNTGGGGFNPAMDKAAPGAPSSWHGATQARGKAGKSVAGPGFGKGAYWAEGGRVGYQNGELVEQETDFIEGPQGGEEFQETVVEGQEQPSREQLEALSMEIFQLPLEELDEQQLLVVYQEAMQGQPMEEAVQEEDVQFAAQGGLAGLL